MVKYRHIFFDLDRTLWDFEKNSEETILELLKEKGLTSRGTLTDELFMRVYKEVNLEMWKQYREGKITKDQLRAQRFYQSLLKFNIDEKDLALEINDHYVSRCSSKTNLLPYSKEILELLSKNYILHIITNGFREAQHKKIDSSGLRNYFGAVIVGDEVGINKPDPRIFHHAIESSSAEFDESIMIGDDFEADILGAKNVGMDQIFFKKEPTDHELSQATYTISHLEELRSIFKI